jgi:uncharacterized protein (DUF427 family)
MMPPSRIPPGPGQESVWDYPRPPRLEPTSRRIRVVFGGITIADSTRALRVLETSHPPTYYVPLDDVVQAHLVPVDGSTYCEWKGDASYFDVVAGEQRARRAAWTYRRPAKPYLSLRNHVAFYAEPMDACFVDDERVSPQPGNFYGGWVTSAVVGPFKGTPGTTGW